MTAEDTSDLGNGLADIASAINRLAEVNEAILAKLDVLLELATES